LARRSTASIWSGTKEMWSWSIWLAMYRRTRIRNMGSRNRPMDVRNIMAD